MNVIANYFDRIVSCLESVRQDPESLERAGNLIAGAYMEGRTIYVFGCTDRSYG